MVINVFLFKVDMEITNLNFIHRYMALQFEKHSSVNVWLVVQT